jgi:hypothetical protein
MALPSQTAPEQREVQLLLLGKVQSDDGIEPVQDALHV